MKQHYYFNRLNVKLFFVVMLLGYFSGIKAQWTTSGTNIYNTNTGNVGIGTNTPNNKFQIGSNTTFSGNDLVICNSNGALAIYNDITETFLYGTKDISIRPGNGQMAIYAKSNGNVGIGTTAPAEKLHVSGNSIITGTIKAGTNSGTITQTTNYPYSTTIETGADAGQILINAGSTTGYVSKISISGRNNGTGIQLFTRSNEIMRVNDEGNVLIGKTTQSNNTYKLDVAGKIRADEIVVNTTGADFVFEKNYKLRTLSELEAFVKEHKHLPEIASAIEMQSNGASLGDMQTKLLQKVEELTLYVIEKDKEIASLKAEKDKHLAEQEKINKEQKKMLLEMKKEIELLKKNQ